MVSKICGRQPLKNLKKYGLLEADSFKRFKGCLLQILLGPFWNPLSQLCPLDNYFPVSYNLSIYQLENYSP